MASSTHKDPRRNVGAFVSGAASAVLGDKESRGEYGANFNKNLLYGMS